MAYTKLNGRNETVQVSEAEHLKEFMDSVQELKPGMDGSLPGTYCQMLFGFMLKHGNLPDTIRKRAMNVMNTAFYKALVQCEKCFVPKKRRFSVAIDVKRSGVHTVEVEAEDEHEASSIVQKRIDSGELRCTDRSTEYLGTDIAEVKEVFDGC